MNITAHLINALAIYLANANVWGRIQAFIRIVNDNELSGAGKRAKVLDMVERDGIRLAAFLVNLLIELGVAKMKSEIVD